MPAERVWARRRTREPRPGAKSRSDGGRIERWRSRILTTALASVLLGLGGYTLHGNLENSRAAHAHRGSLALDALFAEARNAIALEEVHVRNFQVDPTVPVRLRYVAAAGDVTKALDAAARSGGRTDAERIQAEHNAYRQKADRLVAMIANNDPGATPYDRAEVAPAYVALQHDIDAVSRAHHATADREAEELRRQQSSLLAGTTGGYALGLALVAMIWRLVLGYQRRLLAHVAESRRMALHDSLA
jgi:hypothetical protein